MKSLEHATANAEQLNASGKKISCTFLLISYKAAGSNIKDLSKARKQNISLILSNRTATIHAHYSVLSTVP